MPGNARLFQQQDRVLVLALCRVRELPCKGDVPTKSSRTPIEAYWHSEANVFDENVERGRINVDIKTNLLLFPKARELLSQVCGCMASVEGTERAAGRRITFLQKVIDVD